MPDPDINAALAHLQTTLEGLDSRLKGAEASLKGDVIHTSQVTRAWTVGSAATAVVVALIAGGVTAGTYLHRVDEALDRQIPALERASSEMDLRLRALERHHQQGRVIRNTPPEEEGLASGYYRR